MTRGRVAGVLILLGLLIGAPAQAADEPFVRTIDDMVAHLRADPVLVHPVLGSGDTAGAHTMLTRLADEVDVPVYVVLGAIPPELEGAEQPGEQAAALLHAELGDGLYLVDFDDGIAYAGGFGKADDIELKSGYLAIRAAERSGPGDDSRTTAVFDTALLLRAAAEPGWRVGDDELRDLMDEPWAFIPTESHEHADQTARRWVYAISAALAVLIAGLTLSRVAKRYPMAPRGAKERSADAAHAPGMPEAAHREIDRAQRRFAELTPAELGSPQAFAADQALQAARAVVDTDQELDEVGAWVLALIADRELDRMRTPSLKPYRPCVIDPMHGEARGTLRLDGSTIDAPACAACARQPGAFLAARTWRGDRPYLDIDSTWARTGFGALVDDLARQVLDRRGARR